MFRWFSYALAALLWPSVAIAEGCPARAEVSVFHSCEIAAKVELQFHPVSLERSSDDILSVTGTYSSGDRFGVEGLAIQGEKLISSRFQGWDGMMLVAPDGTPQIFNAAAVSVAGKS